MGKLIGISTTVLWSNFGEFRKVDQYKCFLHFRHKLSPILSAKILKYFDCVIEEMWECVSAFIPPVQAHTFKRSDKRFSHIFAFFALVRNQKTFRDFRIFRCLKTTQCKHALLSEATKGFRLFSLIFAFFALVRNQKNFS